MDAHTPPQIVSLSPADKIDDIFKLTLADGLPAEVAGNQIRYKVVTLRETSVADERKAETMAEKAVLVGGSYKLLVSDSAFKHALNMLHIAQFECDGDTIPQALIDLALYDKLSSRDLELIEQRIFLITLAAEVRYGNMQQAEFDNIMAGLAPPRAATSPQPTGQAASVGADAQPLESGPALLADYAGDAAQSAADAHAGRH